MDTSSPAFPFKQSDLVCWIIRRKDGHTIKYVIGDSLRSAPLPVHKTGSSTNTYPKSSFSEMCEHNSTPLPVFAKDGLELRIADAHGARQAYQKRTEDLVVDAGDAIPSFAYDSILSGDREIVETLRGYEDTGQSGLLKIRWADRREPYLHPLFWPAFTALLLDRAKVSMEESGTPYRVLFNCQGGHGRSGSALVSVMMCLTDYTPLDAITHLRAIHCPRAIESIDQHKYLNIVGAALNREENALEAQKVTSFRDRFLSLTSDVAKPYQERLRTQTQEKKNG